MISLALFLVTAVIVGFVTGGLKIQFDRFFVIILLVTLMKVGVFQAVNIFLWIIFLSAGYLLWDNRQRIKLMPLANKRKFLTLVPMLAFVGAFGGNIFYNKTSERGLLYVVGILALLYGLRLLFVHFRPSEMEYKNPKPIFLKICGLFGPIVSGFFVGFVGTSLKPLKIALAVKAFKLNLGQVYLGNTITTFYASFFAILLHSFFANSIKQMTLNNLWLGVALWLAIHTVYKLTSQLFSDNWRKYFQLLVGAVLVVVAFKFI